MPRLVHPSVRPKDFWAHCPDALIGDPDVCWRWLGPYQDSDPTGYGQFDEWPAHRVAFFLNTGKQAGLQDVLHSCDNKWCINPSHLSLGDAKENARQREERGRHGHPGRPGVPRNKIDEYAVRDIRSGNDTIPTYMFRYGLTASWVCKIKSRQAWKHIE